MSAPTTENRCGYFLLFNDGQRKEHTYSDLELQELTQFLNNGKRENSQQKADYKT